MRKINNKIKRRFKNRKKLKKVNNNRLRISLNKTLNNLSAQIIDDNLKKTLGENILTKISLIFSYFSLQKFKEKLDPRKYNGAIFLGLNGPVVKSHGGTDYIGFSNSLDVCHRIVKGNLIEKIKQNI